MTFTHFIPPAPNADPSRLAELQLERIAAANRLRARADDLELNGGDFVREIANGLREGAGRVERGEVL